MILNYSPFKFEIGRLDTGSNPDTPYSLYIYFNKITSPGANLEFDCDFSFYNIRWIQFNFNAKMELVNLEYFAWLLPQLHTKIFRTHGGNPGLNKTD